MTSLLTAINNIPQEKPINFSLYYDNVISAYGKCIYSCWDLNAPQNKVENIDRLIQYLPLKHDKKEGYQMNVILNKLIQGPDY